MRTVLEHSLFDVTFLYASPLLIRSIEILVFVDAQICMLWFLKCLICLICVDTILLRFEIVDDIFDTF